MAVDMYLVIPPATGNPPMGADPVTDLYFKSAFPNAIAVEYNNSVSARKISIPLVRRPRTRRRKGDIQGIAHREVRGHDVSLAVRVECHGRASGSFDVDRLIVQVWRIGWLRLVSSHAMMREVAAPRSHTAAG